MVIAGSTLWAAGALAAEDGEWHSLFNGRDLSGWTIKINKHPLGENYADTFRVEDGVIKVSYDRYGKFDEQFGHLYSNQPYGNYVLRLEYKFMGNAVADSPSWAKFNSGVMIHSQSPHDHGAGPGLAREHGIPVPRRRRHRGKADGQRLHARHQSRDEGQARHRSHHRLHVEALPGR